MTNMSAAATAIANVAAVAVAIAAIVAIVVEVTVAKVIHLAGTIAPMIAPIGAIVAMMIDLIDRDQSIIATSTPIGAMTVAPIGETIIAITMIILVTLLGMVASLHILVRLAVTAVPLSPIAFTRIVRVKFMMT